MSIFGSKKKPNEYQAAYEKMNQQQEIKTAVERIVFDEIKDPFEAPKYADLILQGTPICINFAYLDTVEANRIISFLTGVLYALDSAPRQVQDKAFFFARKQEYMDGTLEEFLSQFN